SSEVRRASPVDFPSSPVSIPVAACCLWTPIVQGLNKVDSESGSDTAVLESSLPMEPIEEESEVISGDDSYSSSKGDADSPETSIDDVIAEGEDVPAEIAIESRITPALDNLGFSAPQISLQTDRDADQVNLQVNPRSVNLSPDIAGHPCPSGSDNACFSNPILVELGEPSRSKEPPPLISCPAEIDPSPAPVALPNDELRVDIPSSSTSSLLTENDSCMPEDSTSGQPSVHPAPDLLQADPSCSNHSEPGSAKDGFQKLHLGAVEVLARRHCRLLSRNTSAARISVACCHAIILAMRLLSSPAGRELQ
ncbi:hypothetical protein Dimus_022294, partial [Dionaea muscipula]